MLKHASYKNDPDWVWWKHGVIYHIYPRSFSDSDGDGIGDLRGILGRLDYLISLGIDAIWLSPVYTSPNFDFGYDVSDYRGINPEYGTMEDLRDLLTACHAAGIRLIMDMILNHTSSQHPWFLESRSSRDNPRRDWYIWKDGRKGRAPNNWKSTMGGSAWEFDPVTGQYYMHSFFREQPDLNWRNQEMAEALFREMKFWLDLGVDGFRLDAINLIVKDKKFRNNPLLWGIPFFQKHLYVRNRPKSIKIAGKLRELIDRYPGRVAIGEVFVLPPGEPSNAARYLGEGENGIHLAFDFSLIFSRWSARAYYRAISDWYFRIPGQGWPCTVLSNHDLFRHTNRFPFSRRIEEKSRVAAFLLLTIRGTPFIYYGDEIGMRNARLERDQIRDPLGKKYWPLFKGRDKARTPMQWTSEENAGFTPGIPWLPVNRDHDERNVKSQDKDPGSLLNVYRSLIRLRQRYPALARGRWLPLLNGREGIIAFIRGRGEESLLVILNFSGRSRVAKLQEHIHGSVLLSTHRREGDTVYMQDMKIHPFEATVYLTNWD